MVEFALAIPVVLILILGIIEAGRLLFIYSMVASAAREGARYGVGLGDNGSGTARYADCAGIRAAVEKIGSFAGIGQAVITYDHGPGTAKFAYCNPKPASVPAGALLITNSDIEIKLGDRVVVEVVANYEPMVPITGFSGFVIQSKDSRSILKDVYIYATQPGGPAYATMTNTPEPTATQTPAPTATNTTVPTATHTTEPGMPTNTPEPTATPVFQCSQFTDSQYSRNNELTLTFNNTSSRPATIDMFSIHWVSRNASQIAKVTSVTFEIVGHPSTTIWTGSSDDMVLQYHSGDPAWANQPFIIPAGMQVKILFTFTANPIPESLSSDLTLQGPCSYHTSY